MTDLERPDRPGEPAPSAPPHPEAGHEFSDISIRGVLWFAAGLLIAAIVIQVGLWLLFEMHQRREKASKQVEAPWTETGKLPPPPLVEGIDPARQFGRWSDQAKQRQAEEQAQQRVRLAIDAAMRQIVAEEAGRAPPQRSGWKTPLESSSGRVLIGEER